jgi:hypothetical protein
LGVSHIIILKSWEVPATTSSNKFYRQGNANIIS